MLKSSMYVDYCWLKKRWRKLGPSDPKNHPRSPVLRLTLTSSAKNKLFLTHKPLTKTESILSQISTSKPSSTADAEIFNVHRRLLAQKPLTKTRTLEPKKSSKKPSSTADADIFNLHKLLLAQKPLTKTRTLGPQNHPKAQFYCWRWHLLRK